MKKLVLAIIAALLVAAVVVAGCGKKEASAPKGAQAILDKSQKASQEVKSLKSSGSADILTPQSEVKESKMTFVMEGNIVSESEVEARITASEDSGKKTDVYIVGGYAYSFDATTGWVKQKVDSAQGLGSGMLTPGQLTGLGKYAENLKELPEEGNNYVLSFDVGPKFFEKSLADVGQSGSQPAGGDQQSAQDMVKLAREMLKGLKMSVVMKIDKTTYLPSETTIKMSLKEIPIIGNMSVDMKMAFTDYNVPVSVALPAEAQNAKEVPAGLPGGLPGIPGLGL